MEFPTNSIPVLPKHPVAEVYEKAYSIGENHANVGKPAISTPDVFVDTYFSGEEYATLSVEYSLTKKEIYEVYKTGYRNMNHGMKELGY